MKADMVRALTDIFEAHAQQTDTGVEFWLARDLQRLLGYAEWRNFTAVLTKAKTACELSGHAVTDHFVEVNKMVDLGSGSQREVDDLMLTRYACYPITHAAFSARDFRSAPEKCCKLVPEYIRDCVSLNQFSA
jgi:DNA-damage-inducible protein D